MSIDPTNSPAPGWYPDPSGSGALRWWDGAAWTQHTSAPAYAAAPASQQGAAAYAQTYGAQTYGTPAYGAQTIPGVPAGTPVYTWFLWVVVLLPLVSVAMLPLLNFHGIAEAAISTTGRAVPPVFTPGYLVVTLVGWITYAGIVALSFGDYRELSRLGYVRPFHWAWAFLGGIVYIIGRSIVARRRSGRGLLPIWISIAIYVLNIVVVIVMIADMFSVIFSGIRYTSGA